MPPFREGPIKIDRKLSGEMLKFLREVGHGHRINIVDASYDIPKGSDVIDFPGATAEAFEAVVRLIPIEGENTESGAKVAEMDWESIDGKEDREVSMLATFALQAAGARLDIDGVSKRSLSDLSEDDILSWGTKTEMPLVGRFAGLHSGQPGFYELANNPNQAKTFIRTQDNLPFACITLIVGHSQRTE